MSRTINTCSIEGLNLLWATTAMTAVVFAATPATAQDASTERSDAANEEIVVTASRTAQNGLDAPTPTQIIGADVIDRQAATTVMEVLNQNPAFKATRSPGANATNVSSPGQATADLRALGGQRTLVLVNGSRVVPFAPASNLGVPTTTDLNLIPTNMIERIDVVTGGASALYGSDAISGVVNLIMKKSHDGIDIKAQSGISDQGDYRTFRIGAIAGTSFGDDRGDIILSLDYSDNSGVGSIYTRDWGRKEELIVPNSGSATNGLPAQILAGNVVNALGRGGVIVGGPAALLDMTFTADGQSIRPFDRGTITAGRVMIGGEGRSLIEDTSLVPPVERFTAYGSIYYDFSDSLTGYVEGGWARTVGELNGVPIRLTSQLIKNDNAYIPAAVRALLPAGTDLRISKFASDFGVNQYRVINETPHGTIGLKGEIGGSWNWDAHTSYGINYYKQRGTQLPVRANLARALDAVDEGAFLTGTANGNIVCRDTLSSDAAVSAAAAGCAPLNFFGNSNFSQAAYDYVFAANDVNVKYTQFTAAANIVGDVFTLPAGPVRVAVGGEYRRETQNLTADPIASLNGYLGSGNGVPYQGKFNVKEAYIEATVPVLADMAGFQRLDLNGAIRYADYSTAGGQTAWKLGGIWEPVEGLNIRVSRSRDIRAPAINELNSPGSNVNSTITLQVPGNPVARTYVIPQNSSAGNPNLNPEKADTFTAGFAFKGTDSLSGLGLSVDYYRIKINGAISNLTAAVVAGLCGEGDTFFCDQFTYGPDPVNVGEQRPIALVSGTLNIGAFKQEGIDMTVNYRTDADFLGDGGYYSLGASGTYVLHSEVDPGTPGSSAVDQAGVHNPYTLGAIPTFRGNLSQTVGNDKWNATLQTIFISKGIQDVRYENGVANDNSVPAVAYFNLFGRFYAGDEKKFELFWAVNNLLDKDPPTTPYFILNAPVNGQYYDKVGRNYMVGARVHF
ncbi:TonB-dependent receptor plug domain-containing protein [Parasphingorhabdus sp.]|uniref:TonB-dependent receptor plug domain-containing protein n=1 Tax=Parasphingorhabdus sp. TaxID=2709688 RepID=UPI003A8D0371